MSTSYNHCPECGAAIAYGHHFWCPDFDAAQKVVPRRFEIKEPLYDGKPYLPTDAKERKEIPICTGVLDYFPLALAEVAKISKAGNDQHNPGEKLHWARGKSMDQADTTIRHIMERGGFDTDGKRHTAKAAWRILAELQIELEEAYGLPPSRGSK
jgi:hypothetical protein